MKIYGALAAAAAATVMVSTAMAAEGQFVIRGDAAKQLLEQNSINIATAEAIGKACVDEATKAGVRVSITIFDQFGEPVYYYRMDGQPKIAIDTAIMKARTVLNTRQPSKAAMNAVASGRASEAAAIFFRQFRQFRRVADRRERQSVHRRDRRWRFGPDSPACGATKSAPGAR